MDLPDDQRRGGPRPSTPRRPGRSRTFPVRCRRRSPDAQEMQIGVSRTEALRHVNDRTEVPELDGFVLSDDPGRQVRRWGREGAAGSVDRADRSVVSERKRWLQKVPLKLLFPMIFMVLPALFIVILGPGAIKVAETSAKQCPGLPAPSDRWEPEQGGNRVGVPTCERLAPRPGLEPPRIASRARRAPTSLQHAAQPGRLVPVGPGGARARAARGQADPALDRLRGLPLVPRHGARVVRGRGDGRAA